MSILNLNSINNFFNTKDATTYSQPQQAANPTMASVFAAESKTDSNAGNNSGSSYLLDLSESAQAYMNGGSAPTESTGSDDSYAFNRLDQAKLNAILKRYKDAPYNDDTFLQIQKDMDAVGIGADKLAAQHHMRDLNPTLMLLTALSG
ncbi:MAG: hypothetical protein ACOYNL_08655, partial [Rickettsiales bacterium]